MLYSDNQKDKLFNLKKSRKVVPNVNLMRPKRRNHGVESYFGSLGIDLASLLVNEKSQDNKKYNQNEVSYK